MRLNCATKCERPRSLIAQAFGISRLLGLVDVEDQPSADAQIVLVEGRVAREVPVRLCHPIRQTLVDFDVQSAADLH